MVHVSVARELACPYVGPNMRRTHRSSTLFDHETLRPSAAPAGDGHQRGHRAHAALQSAVAPSLLLWPTHLPPLPEHEALHPLCPQVTATNVDIARVAPKWHLYTPEEVEEVIARL